MPSDTPVPTPTSDHRPRPGPWAAIALGTSMALVGSYVALSKSLVVVFPIFLLAWLRFAIAAVAMLHWLRRQPGEPPLNAQDRRLLFWESFLGNFLFSLCMLTGVALSSALAAGVIMSAIPAAVALLSWGLLGERPTRPVLWGIACAMAGMMVLSVHKAWATPDPLDAAGWTAVAGHALLLAAVFCEAAYVVIGKRLTARVSPRRISALVNLWGLALMTPLGLWAARSFDFSAVAAPMWALLVFYALAASVVTVWLWMTGLRGIPASSAGVFTVMLPVGAAVVGIVFLGESPTPAHGVAFALALAGIVLATRRA